MKTYTIIYVRDGETKMKHISLGLYESIQECIVRMDVELDQVKFVFHKCLTNVEWKNT